MNGRLENEIKNKEKIQVLLKPLPEYVTDYYYHLAASGILSKSCAEYIRILKRFLSVIEEEKGSIKINEITSKDINKFIVGKQIKKSDNGIAKTTGAYQKTLYSALNKFFDFLYNNNYIDDNPMKTIERPKVKDNVKRIYLTADDMNKILSVVDNGVGSNRAKARQDKWRTRDRAILLLFMNTGIRETALSEINIDDVDFENNTITIIDKTEKTHSFKMNKKLSLALKLWIIHRKHYLKDNETDALFISNHNTRISIDAISDIVRKYSKEALGYELSPHKLRAAFATILYEQTGDLEFVRIAIGHKNIETTKIYAVENRMEKERASSIMESLIG